MAKSNKSRRLRQDGRTVSEHRAHRVDGPVKMVQGDDGKMYPQTLDVYREHGSTDISRRLKRLTPGIKGRVGAHGSSDNEEDPLERPWSRKGTPRINEYQHPKRFQSVSPESETPFHAEQLCLAADPLLYVNRGDYRFPVQKAKREHEENLSHLLRTFSQWAVVNALPQYDHMPVDLIADILGVKRDPERAMPLIIQKRLSELENWNFSPGRLSGETMQDFLVMQILRDMSEGSLASPLGYRRNLRIAKYMLTFAYDRLTNVGHKCWYLCHEDREDWRKLRATFLLDFYEWRDQ